MDVLDMLVGLAKKILGPPAVLKMIKPFTEAAGKQLLDFAHQMDAPATVCIPFT